LIRVFLIFQQNVDLFKKLLPLALTSVHLNPDLAL
jgi:hypothetical protein